MGFSWEREALQIQGEEGESSERLLPALKPWHSANPCLLAPAPHSLSHLHGFPPMCMPVCLPPCSKNAILWGSMPISIQHELLSTRFDPL